MVDPWQFLAGDMRQELPGMRLICERWLSRTGRGVPRRTVMVMGEFQV